VRVATLALLTFTALSAPHALRTFGGSLMVSEKEDAGGGQANRRDQQ
jgi:hypothetical protein